MPNWSKIKAEYIRGGISQRDIAKKYGVSPSTIMRRATKEKWADLRGEIESKAEAKLWQKTVESVSEKKARTEERFDTITDMLLQKIEDGLADGSLMVSGRGMRDITGALKDIREIKGYKSDLDVQEQMARIEKLKKDTQEEQTDKSITVLLKGELGDYAD